MTTRTVEHVLVDIEDQKRQLYHRLKVNDVTVLVDGTPEGDAAIGMTINLILAARDLLAACGAARAVLAGALVPGSLREAVFLQLKAALARAEV